MPTPAWFKDADTLRVVAKVVQLSEQGLTQPAIAERLGISQGSVSNYLARVKALPTSRAKAIVTDTLTKLGFDLDRPLGGALTWAEADRYTAATRLVAAYESILHNILGAGFSPEERQAKLTKADADFRDRLGKLMAGKAVRTPPAASYARDLLDRPARKEQGAEAIKALEESSSPAARYLLDVLRNRRVPGGSE